MPIDMPPMDSAQVNEDNKTEQVSQFRGETAKIQKGEDGKEFMIIDGKKFILAPEAEIKKPELSKIESGGDVVLHSNEEKTINVSSLDESK